MQHAYIKPATPRFNGNVERPHLTDQRRFYQCLEYKDDIGLAKKLRQLESLNKSF